MPSELPDHMRPLPQQRMIRPSQLLEELKEPARLSDERPIQGNARYPVVRDPSREIDMMIDEDLFEDDYEDMLDEMLPPEALLEHYAE